MPNIKLIALDLDGTLLTTDKRLTRENEAALAQAAEAGIEIVPATGRFWSAIPDCVRSLPYIHYAITINGAQALDVRNHRVLSRAELPWERAVEIMACLDGLDVIYDCYQDNWGWMTRAHWEKAEAYAATKPSLEMLRHYRKPVPELKEYLRQQGRGVQKVQAFFRDQALRRRTWAELEERFPETAVTTSIVNNLEINAASATKGRALTELARQLNLQPDQTAAFGDDSNDVSMLRAAGIGVAMGNASPEARAAANRITGTCDENGVAAAIRALLNV